MKKILKYTFFILLIIAIVVIAYVLLKPSVKKELFNYVPEDAALMVYTDKGLSNWEKVRKSEAWKILESQKVLDDIKKSLYKADTLMQKNKMARRLLKERSLLVSLHADEKGELQPLVFIDAEKFSNLSFSLDLLQSRFLERASLKGERITYEDQKIYVVYDQKKDQTYHLTLVEQVLVFSPEMQMIKHFLDHRDNNWLDRPVFKELVDRLGVRGNIQFYLHLQELVPYLEPFLQDQEEFSRWSRPLQFAGFEMDVKEEQVVFNGLVSNADSVAGYINAFQDIPAGRSGVSHWLSQNTASMVSLRFDHFNTLNQQLLEQLAALDSKAYQSYIHQTQIMKDKFNIDVQSHIFNWIDQEIVMGKITPRIGVGRAEDFFVALHASNIETARAMLNEVKRKISDNTPLKFMTQDFKEHAIHYIDLKGFFKIFAGKVFQKIEKPYYTFIEDYVVFSNSAENLKSLIEDYYTNKVLEDIEAYEEVQKELDDRSNIHLFMQTSQLYSTLFYFTEYSGQRELEKFRDLLLSIEGMGVSVKPGDTFIESKIALKLNAEIEKDPLVNFYESEATKPANDYIENLEFRFEPSTFNLPDDTSGVIEVLYPDSALWYKGKLTEGKPEGLWRSYYNSGKMKSSVMYLDHKVSNLAIFFYENAGNTIHIKAKFDENRMEDDYLEYYPSGQLKAKIYYEEGKENGDAVYYYPNGRLFKEGRFKNGEKKGQWTYYDRKGNLVREKKY